MKRCSVTLMLFVTSFSFAAFAQAPPAQTLPARQLDDLVAPIALYPDPLLGQVLAASTYPVEVMEAQQWLDANHHLAGQQLMDAAHQQNWDPSVQALLAVPYALTTLTQDIRWTTDLGNAFLAQQSDVMDAVQRMRGRAQANGKLQSSPQETVSTQGENGQDAIAIEPVNPQEVYVPAYDPEYVWGPGAYPPLYYPSGSWFEPGIDLGFWFPGWGWGFGGWGWGVNWFGHGLFVNTAFFNRFGFHHGFGFGGGTPGRLAWSHDPGHRLGAGYAGGAVNARFGPASQASRMEAGRSGNWHTFGGGNAGVNNNAARSSFAAGSPRGFTPQSQGRFSSTPQRFAAPTQRFQSRPSQRFLSAPQMRAPSAPQRQAAPTARSFGGGGARSAPSHSAGHSSGHGGGRR